jgi:hypothetical protein
MVHSDGLRAVKGVHSLGWEGQEEESWWKSRIVVGECQWVMYLCFGPECLCIYVLGLECLCIYVLGQSAYVFIFLGVGMPMYLCDIRILESLYVD